MVGLGRSSFAGGQVTLSLVGPRSLIAERITVKTRIRNTWLHLLNEELKLEVPADRGIYVCASGYNTINPGGGGGRQRGWRAELNEQVGDFVGKYERKLKQYRVRLCHQYPYDRNNNQEGEDERSPDPVVAAAEPARKRRAPTRGSHEGQGQRRNRPDAAIQRKGRAAPTPDPSGTQKRTEKNSTAAGRRIPSGGGGRGRNSPASHPSIGIISGGVQVASTSTTASNRPLSSPTARNKRNGHCCLTRSLRQRQLLQGTPNQVGRRRRCEPPQPPGSPEPPEVGISVGIPSVPGPHVFIQQVNQEEPEHVDVVDIGDNDEGNGTDGGERGDVEDEDDDDQEIGGGGENQLLNGAGVGVSGGEDGERDEFGTMSDEEDDNGIGGGNAGEGQIGNQLVDVDEGDGVGGGGNPAVIEEFRELGIRYEDVKSLAQRRFSAFSNGHLLRIRNEFRKLKRKDERWMDPFQRSPLAFFFVQQLFKD